MRKLFANRDARVYLIGQSLSLLGDTSLWLAAGIWVKSLTGSNAKAGLVFFFYALAALSSPLAGVVVDRVRRRNVLISVNFLTAAAVLLVLFVHHASDVWIIYVVMVLYGISGGLLSSAQSAFLTVLLPDELLGDANGFLTTIREGLRLIAPLVGAGLFVLAGGAVVAVIDAVSFVIAAAATLSLRIREPKPERRTADKEPFFVELAGGFRHVLGTPVLRRLSIALAVALLVVGFAETAIFAIVASGLHRPPSFLGVILAIQGVGALFGGPSAAPLMKRTGESLLVGIGLGVAAVGSAVLISGNLVLTVVGVVLFGAAVPWIVVGAATLLQRRTPPELQGRAASAFDALATVPQTVSIGCGALLIGIIGWRLELTAMSIVLALSSLIMFVPRQAKYPGETLQAAEIGSAEAA
ncbi:MAG TPA: MFS transporter [Acidimicrobiales bacterium]|nr:MFS transporter [Acidimicrobiales bacterium]